MQIVENDLSDTYPQMSPVLRDRRPSTIETPRNDEAACSTAADFDHLGLLPFILQCLLDIPGACFAL